MTALGLPIAPGCAMAEAVAKLRDLALVNLGIDSMLQGSNLGALKVRSVCHGDQSATRAIVMQHQTQHPCFEEPRSKAQESPDCKDAEKPVCSAQPTRCLRLQWLAYDHCSGRNTYGLASGHAWLITPPPRQTSPSYSTAD